ncbi:hypothetical protein FAY30_26020 (plasmid) [Bacillus sp. S3]|uniref:hypothetical protein n=1 Tax=Bacillus sp. S3 TaxID=486398 RepID=UPI00118C7C8B|nr:hypothetical protein [Bacillus sp. S3]QCJ45412.1 hypothetical protein FAY30_26020 [Bacillus sp. S3]
MTARVTIYTRTSIIMSADSLLSLRTPDKVIGTETIQKVFYIKKNGTGISVFGTGRQNNINIRDILKEFASNLPNQNQTSVASSLSDFMKAKYSNFHTDFVLCGFDGDTPFVFELESKNQWQPVRKNLDDAGNIKSDILGDLSDSTINDIIPLLPNFEQITNIEALKLIDTIFDQEIKNQSKTGKFINVGKPINYLELFPDSHMVIGPLANDSYLD